MKILSENKKAYYKYQVLEKFEAGIVLIGQEVKSIRLGRATLAGSFVILQKEEPLLLNVNIPPYQPKNAPANYDAARSRKLLLTKSEIQRLIGKSAQKGLTLVPLKMYTKQGKIKVEIAVVKNKSKADKRELIKKRDLDREINTELKARG